MNDHHSHTWPRVEGRDHWVACHFCDAQHSVTLIEEGEVAHCLECGQVLYRNRKASLTRAVAYGITALCLMAMAMLFPFISMDAFGNKGVVSVPGAVLSLWEAGGAGISIAIAVFVIGLPFFMISSLLYLCVPLMKGRALPYAVRVMRGFLAVQPWVMVEVFFLGAMISLLKLVKLADVDLGIGFWAVAGLMFCMAGAVGGIDRVELWDRLELAVRRRRK
ncbi:paraquat-inducible protein A [Luteolibacter sp. AS25]|uniref:paraquat-inducible protein A n=1 Tax=Luteolibacter sp. AS25 TaxID=3135776 RepID=UPI00398A81BA